MTSLTSQAPAELYRTHDLAQATYLNLNGHCHQRLEYKRGRCLWVFLLVGNLHELIDLYQRGEGAVDPQDFAREISDVRFEMYDFLNSQKAKRS